MAICTHNRAGVLPTVVRSVVHQADEVLVVDNASTDDTAVAVQELITNYPNVRYVTEPTVGLSHARNRALAEAEHEIVVFVDDDAVAEDGFVAAHVAAYEDFRVGATGGRIDLAWPKGRRPRWLAALAAANGLPQSASRSALVGAHGFVWGSHSHL